MSRELEKKVSEFISASGRFKVSSRILVVDSSASARALIMKAFQNKATMIECVACKNAKEALEHLEKETFNVVTTSLLLPDMDGLELCRRIRSNKSTRLTPVIVISGDADERLLMEGFSAGVTDYFDKSRGHTELAEFVTRYLECTSGTAHRILLVEDSPTVATAVTKMLTKQGMEVTHYGSAEDALELLEATDSNAAFNTQFDLVLTDFHLDGKMTGGDLLHAIRARLKYGPQELPVLVMTGSDSVDQQVEVFNAGANDYVGKPVSEQALVARVRSLVLVRQQYCALQRQKQQMEVLSMTDSLTTTFNRRYLMDYGFQLSTDPDELPLSVMIIDLDHFKVINDQHGHLKGDKVLSSVGKKLKYNIPADGVTIRYGGEEFCILLPNYDIDQARLLAEKLRSKVEQMDIEGVKVTLSIGVSVINDEHPDDLETALKKADVALYSAKKDGRNRVEVATT
jgi:two-component system cell cycle response regulator